MKYRALILWIVLAFVLCLTPGPDWWEERLGSEGRSQRTEVSGLEQAVEQMSEVGDQTAEGGEAATTKNQELSTTHPVADAVLNDHRKVKELGTHFILMAGIAFCFIRVLNSSQFSTLRPLSSGLRSLFLVLYSLIVVLLISSSIEFFQELLPESFAHGFAISDIWYSLAGGLLGALLGLVRMKIFPPPSETC